MFDSGDLDTEDYRPPPLWESILVLIIVLALTICGHTHGRHPRRGAALNSNSTQEPRLRMSE